MKNYFSVFDLTPAFDIDTRTLEKSYFNAQRLFHPDRLVGKGPMERQQAVLHSMLVNEATAGTCKTFIGAKQHNGR
jgi:molecular chaperone HscB